MNTQNKIRCFQCLARKEKIDRIERDFLMLEAWVKHLRDDITSLVEMKNRLDAKIEEIKEDYNREFIGCIEDG